MSELKDKTGEEMNTLPTDTESEQVTLMESGSQELNGAETDIRPEAQTADGTGADAETFDENETETETTDETEADAETADENETDTSSDTDPAEPKESVISVLFDYLEILALSVCLVLAVFSFAARVCVVNGNSMRNTLENGQVLVTTNLKAPETGDIIVFHMTSSNVDRLNEPLVKRVIAKSGQTVTINCYEKTVTVDGKDLAEDYACYLDGNFRDIGVLRQWPEYSYDHVTGIFTAEVPDGCLFVMGDNRNNSLDSRTNAIGMVDERRVLGTVLFRVKPFTRFS